MKPKPAPDQSWIFHGTEDEPVTDRPMRTVRETRELAGLTLVFFKDGSCASLKTMMTSEAWEFVPEDEVLRRRRFALCSLAERNAKSSDPLHHEVLLTWCRSWGWHDWPVVLDVGGGDGLGVLTFATTEEDARRIIGEEYPLAPIKHVLSPFLVPR